MASGNVRSVALTAIVYLSPALTVEVTVIFPEISSIANFPSPLFDTLSISYITLPRNPVSTSVAVTYKNAQSQWLYVQTTFVTYVCRTNKQASTDLSQCNLSHADCSRVWFV